MSATLKIACLAILQGVTEFLPVSSSGHLVLAKHLVGLETPSGPFLEVILHAGTLVSITVYYRARLVSLAAGILRRDGKALRFIACLLLACVPAIAAYLVAGDMIESLFDRPRVAAAMLCATGACLLSLHWAPSGSGTPGAGAALLMGVAQALAMVPGISRSGSTIAMGRWLKVGPEEAAETSFLMVLPLLAGASLLELLKILNGGVTTGLTSGALVLGFLLAAATGYVALALLVRLLADHRFYLFGVYCLLAGTAGWIALLAG